MEASNAAARKALAFADAFMIVEALVAVAHDWERLDDRGGWRLLEVATG